MKRRKVLQFLTAGVASLWSRTLPPGNSLLEAAIPNRAFQELPADNANLLLPLFPLNLVLFPETNLPLHIFEPRYKEMIQDCLDNGWEFGILLGSGRIRQQHRLYRFHFRSVSPFSGRPIEHSGSR